MTKGKMGPVADLSERMRRIKKKDTKPEMVVRRILWGMGYRYRLHGKGLPGTPDIIFSSKHKAIFVHGCFWHQHGCSLTNLPTSNETYWHPKLRRNVERDAEALIKLEQAGWKTLIVWECELKSENLKARLRAFLDVE